MQPARRKDIPDIRNADPETIRLIYRSSAVQVINIGAAALNLAVIAAFDFKITPLAIIAITLVASVLTANAVARFLYRLNPYCLVCGLDSVDGKINRRSLSDHPKN